MKRTIKITYTLTKKDKRRFELSLRNRNITHTEFAKKIGITYGMLCYILNGVRALTEEMEEKFRLNGVFFDVEE